MQCNCNRMKDLRRYKRRKASGIRELAVNPGRTENSVTETQLLVVISTTSQFLLSFWEIIYARNVSSAPKLDAAAKGSIG